MKILNIPLLHLMVKARNYCISASVHLIRKYFWILFGHGCIGFKMCLDHRHCVVLYLGKSLLLFTNNTNHFLRWPPILHFGWLYVMLSQSHNTLLWSQTSEISAWGSFDLAISFEGPAFCFARSTVRDHESWKIDLGFGAKIIWQNITFVEQRILTFCRMVAFKCWSAMLIMHIFFLSEFGLFPETV